MSNFKVSVIIPVYNGAGKELLLKKQLDSVLNQTYKNIEVILVNDGSKDNSSELCQMYALTDSRIKVVDKQNGGESSSRNIGIDFAIGDYVSIIDQDDELDLNMYEYAFTRMRGEPSIIKFDYRIKRKDSSIVVNNSYPVNQLLKRVYIVNEIIPFTIETKIDNNRKFSGHWSMIIKKSFLYKYNLRYDINLPKMNDSKFIIDVLAKADSMVYFDKPMYKWIKRDGSLTSCYSEMFEGIVDCSNYYEELFKEEDYDFRSQDKIQHNIKFSLEAIELVMLRKSVFKAISKLYSIITNDSFIEWIGLLKPYDEYTRIIKYLLLHKMNFVCIVYFYLHFLIKRVANFKRRLSIG